MNLKYAAEMFDSYKNSMDDVTYVVKQSVGYSASQVKIQKRNVEPFGIENAPSI